MTPNTTLCYTPRFFFPLIFELSLIICFHHVLLLDIYNKNRGMKSQVNTMYEFYIGSSFPENNNPAFSITLLILIF
jgi:hypothetical protein